MTETGPLRLIEERTIEVVHPLSDSIEVNSWLVPAEA